MGKKHIEGRGTMILYVNGDSYSSDCNGDRYSDYIGKHLGCPSINAAVTGSSNGRILRTSLRDLLELKQQHDNIIAVISLSFIVRTELWEKNHSEYVYKNSNDGDFFTIQFPESKNWIELLHLKKSLNVDRKYQDYGLAWLNWFDVEAETTKLLQHLVLFTSWCKQHKIKYVIFSGALQEPIDFSSPFVKPFYDEIANDPCIMDLYNKSFTEWSNNQGYPTLDDFTQVIFNKSYNISHPATEGHAAFANYLLENYIKVQL